MFIVYYWCSSWKFIAEQIQCTNYGCHSVVVHLPSMHEYLNLIVSTTEKKIILLCRWWVLWLESWQWPLKVHMLRGQSLQYVIGRHQSQDVGSCGRSLPLGSGPWMFSGTLVSLALWLPALEISAHSIPTPAIICHSLPVVLPRTERPENLQNGANQLFLFLS
jgi:hypothetical protein